VGVALSGYALEIPLLRTIFYLFNWVEAGSLIRSLSSRFKPIPYTVGMFVVWFPASLVWKQPATTTQRISSYHWTTTKWICLKIKRQSSPNHHTVRFPLRMMNSENKTRPRYLQELPLIPIDEIYSKSFRWNRIGCYALYNGDQALCYVGYTKNLQRKIAFHAKLQPDNCKFFKAFVVENPKVSAAYLEKILDAWLLEYGSVPPGNSTQRHLWEGRKPRQEVGQDNNNNNNNRKTTTTFRVNDFFDGKDSFSLGSSK
jgi:predicted GIY-YIG superfamily endonuclease